MKGSRFAIFAWVLELSGALLVPIPARRARGHRRHLATRLAAGKGELPLTTKDTISQMTAATQAALQSRCSRMDIELPPGAKFGVEKADKSNNMVNRKAYVVDSCYSPYE